MSHVIIDRRLNDAGKSSVNRQKFIDRVRDFLQHGAKEAIGNIKIADISRGSKKVNLPIKNLDEPSFSHDNEGIHHKIYPGNRHYQVGDKIPRPPSGQSGQGGEGDPEGEDGEDGFAFTLTKEEFLDFFFENCELPNMVRKQISKTNEYINQRSGYRSDGTPSTLNVIRSMRYAKSRKFGFQSGKKKKIKELEKRFQELCDMEEKAEREGYSHKMSWNAKGIVREKEAILVEIEELKAKIKKIPFIDPIDLRYNAWSKVEVPAVQAVMFCMLDISGSMDEEKKELAKTFFMLLYLFIERNYEHVELVFICHTTTANEVDEETFFHSKENGGTVVSPAIELMLQIINERYSLDSWNVFVAQGSDGDNWGNDNHRVRDLLTNQVLPIVQYYAYAQINTQDDWRGQPATNDPYNMWSLFHTLSQTQPKLGCGMITCDADVYKIFTKLFEKKAAITV